MKVHCASIHVTSGTCCFHSSFITLALLTHPNLNKKHWKLWKALRICSLSRSLALKAKTVARFSFLARRLQVALCVYIVFMNAAQRSQHTTIGWSQVWVVRVQKREWETHVDLKTKMVRCVLALATAHSSPYNSSALKQETDCAPCDAALQPSLFAVF